MREYIIQYVKDGRNCIEWFAVCSFEVLCAEVDNIKANGGENIVIDFIVMGV